MSNIVGELATLLSGEQQKSLLAEAQKCAGGCAN